MDLTVLAWGGFAVFVLGLLALDLGVLNRRDEVVSLRQSLLMCLFYFVLAMSFGAGVWYLRGPVSGMEFLTGYLIELSLSIDNIFVIALVFTAFAVPPRYQHRVLFWGIIGALVMRAGMILAGTALVREFHWILYLFGAFLVFTGIKMVVAADAEPAPEKIWLVRLARRFFRVTRDFHDHNFFVTIDGVRHATPLFLALLAVEAVDVVFAVDSIPAIFAITTDPFIVFTSNVFAILGLRSLYFALAGLLPRFRYLKYGLALLLVVVGVKMLMVDFYKMPTWVALSLIVGIIGGSVLLSIWKTRNEGPQAAPEPLDSRDP
ncbi:MULTISPECIES: TerC family protein [unclassified Haematospirillum]|uniref:TerC family protein n=1 Tax=unclassified Haematospirillum TaxID=2622088 RepID=UPI001438C20B|nr:MULTISPECIES: TerC family protein [unclassified Haematospirillum]NKD54870.1 TerC family protein [Haematospirillum sp. H4890]NKD74708.1 TerC family protein [Haematospirillum sp. H4485]NKD87407.1 TerC family protein [Haematospirillum sp. 15-248]